MNAEEAARFLGCSSKTVRRHLKKGTITASRKASGELKISEDQVEKLRLVLELEDTSRPVHPKVSVGRPEQADMSRQVETDIERRLASMAQSIANLNATVANQTRRIGELAARVAQLEGQASLVVPGQSIPPSPTSDLIPQTKPQKRNVDANSPISDGWVLCSDFFKQYEISETSWRRWIKNGLSGDRFECEESLLPDGKIGRYFNEEQQEKAIELLRKHGKLDTN